MRKFSRFEKELRNVLTKKTFFCLTEINIIFTEIHRINTNKAGLFEGSFSWGRVI